MGALKLCGTQLTKEEFMSLIGWYYLHVNGDLIYKRETRGTAADIRESDLARGLWPVDPEDRAGAWKLLVEATAAGARRERIADLAAKWGCTDRDASNYADHVGFALFLDGDQWCATKQNFINVQESPVGFGPTAIDAAANLALALGYRPSKLWRAGFHDLVKSDQQ